MIRLRALTTDDLEQMRQWRNDPGVKDNCREFRMISDVHQLTWWEEYCQDAYQKPPKQLLYGIEHEYSTDTHDVAELIGVCGWVYIDWLNRRAELSIYIGAEHRGQGYFYPTMDELHRIAFDELGFNSVELEVHSWNWAAQLYRNFGYVEIGWKRESVWRNRGYWGTLMMDMLASEWKGESREPMQ